VLANTKSHNHEPLWSDWVTYVISLSLAWAKRVVCWRTHFVFLTLAAGMTALLTLITQWPRAGVWLLRNAIGPPVESDVLLIEERSAGSSKPCGMSGAVNQPLAASNSATRAGRAALTRTKTSYFRLALKSNVRCFCSSSDECWLSKWDLSTLEYQSVTDIEPLLRPGDADWLMHMGQTVAGYYHRFLITLVICLLHRWDPPLTCNLSVII